MKMIRRASVLRGAIFCLLSLSPAAAYSQQVPPRAYLFVEVKDTKGKAVDGAAVALSGLPEQVKTNKGGVAEASFELWHRSRHYELQVSKPGYMTSEHVVFIGGRYAREDFPAAPEDPYGSRPPPIRVTLSAPPSTPAERRAVELEDRRRQLLLAAKRGDPASLRRLLAAGASADAADAAGVPAVTWAAFAGDAETIKVLLDAGADVRNKNGPGHQALLVYLTEGISRDKTTAADRGAVERYEEVVRRLLRAGAGVNLRDPRRGTVLNNAIARTPYWDQPPHTLSAETIRLLLAAGADVNVADAEGKTPLMSAAALNSAELVKLLLGAGASVHPRDRRGQTALMYAEGYRQDAASLGAARLLIAAGANVNDADAEGQTPLMRAVRKHFVGGIKMLLDAGAGASVNVRDKRGRTALLHVGWELYGDASTEMTRLLVAAGADVNAADAEGRTALMSAAAAGPTYEVDNVKLLLAAGADVNLADRKGRTALSIAKEAGNRMAVGLLEEAAARR